jgi:type IV pilus assembly protein PilX
LQAVSGKREVFMSSTCRSVRFIGSTGAAQRGAVLVIALIFLLLLTILAISASNRSLLQQRMAGGLLNAQRAEMSAQTALRGIEWLLWSTSNMVGAKPNCDLITACYNESDPSHPPNPDVVNVRTKPGWVTAGSAEYLGLAGSINFTTPEHGNLAENPRYIIEDLGSSRPPGSGALTECGTTGACSGNDQKGIYEVYRITARAMGGDPNTVRVLESTFMVAQ